MMLYGREHLGQMRRSRDPPRELTETAVAASMSTGAAAPESSALPSPSLPSPRLSPEPGPTALASPRAERQGVAGRWPPATAAAAAARGTGSAPPEARAPGGGCSSSSSPLLLAVSAKPRLCCPTPSSRRRFGGGAANDDTSGLVKRPRPAPRAGAPVPDPHIAGAARRRWPRAASGGQRGANNQREARKTSTAGAASTPAARVSRSTSHRTGPAAAGGRRGSIQTKASAARRGSRYE